MESQVFPQIFAENGAGVENETYESSSDEDDDGYDNDPEITLQSIEKSRIINFSIRANYTAWRPREAFRELVQNWRDAIIKSFHLAEQDFCVIREEKTSGRSTEIVYKVPRLDADDRKEWLGYIRFKARDGEGTIDITNRSATLQPWHLDLGGTSKAGDEQQAGAHGEGLKLAVLVLMRGRQNHNVRCRSGGFNWNFNFTTRGRLVARLSRMSHNRIQTAEDQARRLSMRTLLPFGAKPTGDVQFLIGEGRRGRDEWGGAVKRSPVRREDFDAWTAAALFLHDAQDGAIISTESGDLLTSPQLRGNIYLKGLLLKESTAWRSASITNQPLKFGYNFAHGRTNRERQSVAGADEESMAILAIWDQVLAAKPEMVQELHGMLNTTEPRYADVSGAKSHMKIEMASRLKEYLLGEEFAGKWYYCGEDKSKNPRLDHIIQGLGCEGVELTNEYWTILRSHDLVRTAEEEEYQRFMAAPPVEVPETAFATSVCRLLRACARACPQTNDTAVSFVRAGQLHLQLFFSEAERLFRVHERCLSVDGAISELGLPDDMVEADVIFHTVKRLFADALEQLPRDVFLEDNTRTTEWRRKLELSRAEQRLLNHLRVGELGFEDFVSAGGSEFRERWAVNTQWASCSEVEVQCHRASRCSHLRDSVLIAEDTRAENLACIAREGVPRRQTGENELVASEPPACQVYRYDNLAEVRCEFQLEEGVEYFIMLVLPTDPGSFVVLSSVGSLPHRPRPRPDVAVMVKPPHSAIDRRVTASQNIESPESSVLELRRPQAHSSPEASDNDNDNSSSSSGERFSSPEPEPIIIDGDSPPPNASLAAEEPAAAAAAAASAVATAPAPVGSFVLGPRLQSLDIFGINRNRWYVAESRENVRAVIGIMNGEKYLPEETRKRRRADVEEEDGAPASSSWAS